MSNHPTYGPQTDSDGCCVTCGLKLWYVTQRGDLLWRDCGCWLFSDDPRYDPLNGPGPLAPAHPWAL
jgi:hypothetical protein